MIDISPFTDEQWYAMCNRNMGLPVPLSEADIDRPFVYDRTWGLFYVPMGYHGQVMALLLAFHHGFVCPIEYAESIGRENHYNITDELADAYLLERPGTVMSSSVGTHLQVGRRSHLDAAERRVFREFRICYLEDSE